MKRNFFAIVFTFFCLISTRPQNKSYEFKFHNFFDNREYFNNFTEDKTIFGFLLQGNLNLKIYDFNKVKLGLTYLQEFGKRKINTPDFIGYYEFNKNNLTFVFGAFPFSDYISQPLILLNDTLQYYKPIFEGIFLQYAKTDFSSNIWIDWVQKQDTNKKETFVIGSTVVFKKNWFNYRHDLQFIHKALPLNPAPNEHIIDNGGILITGGINFNYWLKDFDNLSANTGITMSYYRERTITPLLFYYGFYSQLNALIKNFGTTITAYKGNGHNLIFGDHFYLAKKYIRTDIFYNLNYKTSITFQIRFSFHYVENKIDNSQLIKLIVKI